MEKIELLGASQEKIIKLMEELGEKSFRGKQIFKWLMRGAVSFDEMTDLSESLRAKLKDHFSIGASEIVEVKTSDTTDTKKYLLRMKDGSLVEAVRMGYEHGYSACISTQVGCHMGCAFCASSKLGFVRNLTAGEMLDEVLAMNRDNEEKITHIVLMGVGEPLVNYENVLKFIRLIHNKDGLNIGIRRVTLSTSGVVPKILELADSDLPVTLSISLHSADEKMRSYLMPINKKYDLSELMEAVRYYTDKTGRRATFEYILIKGMTDGKENADKLIKLVKGMLCHVNLIPYNPVEGLSFKRPSGKEISYFRDLLKEAGIEVTVRREMGGNIEAACGQLRNRYVTVDQ